MVPTTIVVGLLLGRWWRVALGAAAVLWGTLLLTSGATGFDWGLAAGVALGMANAAAGILVHRAVLHLVRRFTARSAV